MIKVGLTGNYKSGYEEVSDIFRANKVPVFDADVILRYLFNYSESHISKVINKFGKDIYKVGLLDLKKIEGDKKMDELLDIVHLDIIKSYERWRLKKWQCPYTIFKCSILFERSFSNHMNFNISVYKPKQHRKKDCYKNGMIRTFVDTLIESEMDELYKNKNSNYVVNNSDIYKEDYSEIEKQVSFIDQSLKKKSNDIRKVNSDYNYPTYDNIMS